MRHSSALASSACTPSARGWLDCRYAADIMISLFSHFSDQPCAMKRAARSSSSSGCVGFSPCTPKSLAVATSGLPKCQPHTRFTITRAASGARIGEDPFRQLEAARAVLERGVVPLESTAGNPRGTISPGAATLPPQHRHVRGLRRACSNPGVGGIGRIDELRRLVHRVHVRFGRRSTRPAAGCAAAAAAGGTLAAGGRRLVGGGWCRAHGAADSSTSPGSA